jgi:hypothetical protein
MTLVPGYDGRLSGMFIPYDDDAAFEKACFGRVVDVLLLLVVNTATDFAHVIWNVGWRR